MLLFLFQLDFERMVQARHARNASFLPSKGNVLSNVLGVAFTHAGRAVVMCYMSPFAADKKITTRVLGLGLPIADSGTL